MSELYLVRHAQASFEGDNYDDLSNLGCHQSERLGMYLATAGIRFQHVFTGAMQRHRQTLEHALSAPGTMAPRQWQVHRGFDEYDFRIMIGAYCKARPDDPLVRGIHDAPEDRRQYFRLLRRVLHSWARDELESVPETWSDFRNRVGDARDCISGLAQRDDKVLVVSSGGAISHFVGAVLGLAPERIFDLNLQIKNTGVTRFNFSGDRYALHEFNSIPHLEGPEHSSLITYS